MAGILELSGACLLGGVKCMLVSKGTWVVVLYVRRRVIACLEEWTLKRGIGENEFEGRKVQFDRKSAFYSPEKATHRANTVGLCQRMTGNSGTTSIP